ncbi:MAG: glycosyl transferase family 1 [Mucilaginibacter sp.]|nr:glycosyl transferase family 1 [Mucilaginibacter sp.]
MRLAIITTHPIQYYAPVFKLLNERGRIDINVFYTLGPENGDRYDQGFGKSISWDIPLVEGYPYEWVENAALQPGSHHYKGIKTPTLIQEVQAWQPDAVLVFGWAYQSHLKALRYFKGRIPVYFRGDSTLLDETQGLKKLLRAVFLYWVYQHVDHAFYVGTNNKAYFKKYGLKDKQLSFAPHAIDNQRFGVDRKDEASALRRKLGVKNSDILILFAGKFSDKKSPVLLADAFLNLKKPDVHLLFAGNGKLEQQLESKARGAGNIHFMDFQNQLYMPVIYQAADLFCLPSKGPGETWGLAVNEAMACGKAILVSDKVGCAVDLVKEKYNGAIFKSGKIFDLTACLEQLTTSRPQLERMGNHSAEMIKDWNFLKIAEAIEISLMQAK